MHQWVETNVDKLQQQQIKSILEKQEESQLQVDFCKQIKIQGNQELNNAKPDFGKTPILEFTDILNFKIKENKFHPGQAKKLEIDLQHQGNQHESREKSYAQIKEDFPQDKNPLSEKFSCI